MGEFAIGQSVLRREDPRLLRGQGRFFDDLKLADQLHAAIVRSPHAHADITGIDTRAALQMPGVHAVLTGADYRGDDLGSLPSMAAYQRRGGGPMFLPPRPAIAFNRVMHVGYPVAVVVADALDLARDAAERVVVDYEPRPGVVSARDAFAPDAPQLYDECPNNEAYFYQAGDKAKVDAAFAAAAHVVEQRLIINRVTANPIEPRGVTGVYDAGSGRFTLHCGFQRPWLFRSDIAETTLKIPEAELRLVTGDIGGSYGMRGSVYPEIILMLWAARRVGRPVKWVQTRNEAHISDDDARDNIVDAALALDRDGKFLAVKIRSFGNLGAFVSFRGAMPPVVNIGTVCGVYLTPALHVAVSGMLTNTHCTSPYRGAGRPEASYMIERLIYIAADEMGIDPAELRRRNTIPPSAMPYKTPLTFTYDSRRFEENQPRPCLRRPGPRQQAGRASRTDHQDLGRRRDGRRHSEGESASDARAPAPGGVLPLNQTAQLVLPDLAYHDYEGVALDLDERPRLQRDLSRHNIMLLRNHGTLTVGRSVAEAFLRMYLLERACTMQVRTFALGGTPHPTAPAVIEKNAALAQGGGMSTVAENLAWPALLRK